MVLFKSPHPDIDVPTNLTTWEWLFENPSTSPLYRHPSTTPGAYIDALTSETLTLPEVKRKATALSAALSRHYGLAPGVAVSLFSTNTIWYPVAMWAVVRAGGMVSGASPAYGVGEMVQALRTSKSVVIMTLPGKGLGVAVEAAGKVGLGRDRVLLLEGRVEGFTSIQDLIARGEEMQAGDYWRIPRGMSNKRVCGYLNFSSGTTGLPKAVMVSHHNIIAQCLQLKQVQAPDEDRYKVLAVMPLFHITGVVRFCHYAPFMNGHSIMLPSFTMPSMLDAIVKYRVKELILVPPILIRLVRDPVVDAYLPRLRHVERWSSGSAPIAPEIISLLQKKFPWTGFRQGYGATESTACISSHPPGFFDYKYAAAGGQLVANTVAKVMGIDDGRELGVGQTGEIWAKGPQITVMGYLGNPAATKESFDAEGFLHTGDVGHIDELGMIHIEDRIKEMIKVKGLQVPPAELEDLLLGHEDVEDAAVIGIPDAYSGERPKGFVVLRAGVRPSVEVGRKLLAFAKERKVRYKWLVEIEFVDSVPKSASGKLLRRVLKVQDKEGKISGLRVRDEERERARARL